MHLLTFSSIGLVRTLFASFCLASPCSSNCLGGSYLLIAFAAGSTPVPTPIPAFAHALSPPPNLDPLRPGNPLPRERSLVKSQVIRYYGAAVPVTNPGLIVGGEREQGPW